jgi:tryptophan-rich sensory protein
MIPVLFWALLSTAVAAAAPQITQEVVAQPNWGWPSAPTPSVWGALFYGLIAASLYILARASVSMGRGLARKGVLPFALRL